MTFVLVDFKATFQGLCRRSYSSPMLLFCLCCNCSCSMLKLCLLDNRVVLIEQENYHRLTLKLVSLGEITTFSR